MSESSFEIKQECPCSSEEMYEKPKKQMAYECGKSQGPWSLEEHQKYIIFMEHNVNDKKRKMHKKYEHGVRQDFEIVQVDVEIRRHKKLAAVPFAPPKTRIKVQKYSDYDLKIKEEVQPGRVQQPV